jgi:hypothetical protein
MPKALEDPRFDFIWTQKRPWVQDSLLIAAIALDRPLWSGLNSISRLALLGPGMWALRLASHLNASNKNNPVKWIARHSVLNPAQFQLALSDIDLSAVYRRSPSDEDLDRLATFYRRARTLAPSLGEIEVYTQAEWNTRQRILAVPGVGALINALWNFRKMGWIEKSLLTDSHPYHVYKKERALAACWKKLGEAPHDQGPHRRARLGSGFRVQLTEIFKTLKIPSPAQSDAIEFYCDYLQCTISSVSKAEQMIHLPPELALPWLAVLPPAQNLDPELETRVQALRAHPAVERARKFVVLYQWLGAMSRLRTHPSTAKMNEPWRQRLKWVLATGAPLRWPRPKNT